MDTLQKISDLIQENNIEEAYNLIVDSESDFTNNSNYWNLRGILCLKVNEFKSAIGCLEKSLLLNPINGDAFYNYSYALENLGEKWESEHYLYLAYQFTDDNGLKDEISSHLNDVNLDEEKIIEIANKYNNVPTEDNITLDLENSYSSKEQGTERAGRNQYPLLSIIIPAYNAEKYIRETIESAINQTVVDKDIIIVNDGSSDNTLSIIKEYEHYSGIRIYDNVINRGANYTYNYGLLQSNAKYVTFLDSDDIYLPGYCQTIIDKIEQSKADLGFANLFALEGTRKLETTLYGNPRDKRFQNVFGGPNNTFPIHPRLRQMVLQGVHISPRSIYKRELFNKFGLEDYRLRIAHDWLRHIRFLINDAKCVFVDEALGYYRIHSEGNSQKSGLDNLIENLKVMEIVEKELSHLMNEEEKNVAIDMKKQIRNNLFVSLANFEVPTAEIVQFLVNKNFNI